MYAQGCLASSTNGWNIQIGGCQAGERTAVWFLLVCCWLGGRLQRLNRERTERIYGTEGRDVSSKGQVSRDLPSRSSIRLRHFAKSGRVSFSFRLSRSLRSLGPPTTGAHIPTICGSARNIGKQGGTLSSTTGT